VPVQSRCKAVISTLAKTISVKTIIIPPLKGLAAYAAEVLPSYSVNIPSGSLWIPPAINVGVGRILLWAAISL